MYSCYGMYCLFVLSDAVPCTARHLGLVLKLCYLIPFSVRQSIRAEPLVW